MTGIQKSRSVCTRAAKRVSGLARENRLHFSELWGQEAEVRVAQSGPGGDDTLGAVSSRGGRRELSGVPFVRALIPRGPRPGDEIASQRPRHPTPSQCGSGSTSESCGDREGPATARADGGCAPAPGKRHFRKEARGGVTAGDGVGGRGLSPSPAPPVLTRGSQKAGTLLSGSPDITP